MAKKLFFLEFRRALPSFLIFTVAISVSMEGFELAYTHFQKTPSTIHEVVNILLLSIIVILGFPSGARAFSGTFKETQYVFLQSLPLRRDRAWLALVLANLAASLGSLLVIPALRPSIFIQLPKDADVPADLAASVLAGYFLLFAAGCCFSLLFSKVILNYVMGFIVTLATLAALFELVLYAISFPRINWEMMRYDGSGDLPLAIVCYSIPILIFLILSLRFFVRGEFNLAKVQIRNSISVVASLFLLVVTLSISVDLGWFAMFDKWEQAHMEVSRDGRYLLVQELRAAHPQISRLSIVQVSDGKLVGRFNRRGVADATWSSADDSLIVTIFERSPLFRLEYLLPESDQILRFSSEGKELSSRTFRFAQIVSSTTMPDGKMMLVWKKGDTGTIGLLDERSGGIKELAGDFLGGLEYYSVSIERTPAGPLVLFQNPEVPPSIWMVGSEAKRLAWALPEGKLDWPMCVLQGTAYHSPDQCLKKLNSLFPFQAEGKIDPKLEGPGMYLFGDPRYRYEWSSNIGYLDEGTTVFYVESDHAKQHGKLYILDRQKKSWRLLAEDIPLRFYDVRQEGFNPFNMSSVSTDSSQGIVAYIKDTGATLDAYLYDDNLQRTTEIGSIAKSSGGENSTLEMIRVLGLNGIAVFFGTNNEKSFQGITAEYIPQSGQLLKFAILGAWSRSEGTLYMDQTGNRIVSRGNDTGIVSYLTADEKERQLWPLAK